MKIDKKEMIASQQLNTTQTNIINILKEADDFLQSQSIVSHSVYSLLKVNYEKTKQNPFIYNHSFILSLREHEVVQKNIVLIYQLKKQLTEYKTIDNVKIIITTTKKNYMTYIYNNSAFK